MNDRTTTRTPRLSALAAWSLPALLLAAGMLWAWAASGQQWWAQSLRTPMFVRCGLMLMGCLLVLEFVLLAMLRLGRRVPASLASDQRGVAILEFAILLPVAMTVVLIMIQIALAMAGNVLVNYAAYCAARSAVVWIPAETTDEPRNVLDGVGSYKYNRIRQAAVLAVAPVGANISQGQGSLNSRAVTAGLQRFFGRGGQAAPGWLGTQVERRISYADAHTEVEVAPPANGSQYGEREDIVVTVTHEFFLAVPYVRMAFGGQPLSGSAGQYFSTITATHRLVNQGRDDDVIIEYGPNGVPITPYGY